MSLLAESLSGDTLQVPRVEVAVGGVPAETLGYSALKNQASAVYILATTDESDFTFVPSPTGNEHPSNVIRRLFPSYENHPYTRAARFSRNATDAAVATHAELAEVSERDPRQVSQAIGRVLHHSPYLRDQYATWVEAGGPIELDSYSRWLLGDRSRSGDMAQPGGKSYELDADRLLMFFQLNQHVLRREQQKPENQEMVREAKFGWETAVRTMVRGRVYDESAYERLAKLSDLPVYVGDDFSFMRKGFEDFAGYHVPGSSMVVIKKDMGARIGPSLVYHELFHALGWGGDAEARARGEQSPFENTWIDEAITEHSTQIAVGNSTGDRINLQEGAYVSYRWLLQLVTEHMIARGSEIILADYTRTYSASGPKRAQQIAAINDEASRYLDIGGDPFGAIQQSINKYAKFHQERGSSLSTVQLQQIGADAICRNTVYGQSVKIV